jgi:hypothetical protein
MNQQQHYARIEWAILDLQLSISSVKRANDCLDLDTVQRTRQRAAETLNHSHQILEKLGAEPAQARRAAKQRECLAMLLREPSPIEQLARTLHVG